MKICIYILKIVSSLYEESKFCMIINVCFILHQHFQIILIRNKIIVFFLFLVYN